MTQNKLPKDWKVVKLGELCDKMANGANAKQFEDQIGLPISRIETIWNEDIDLKRVKYIYENDEAFIEKYALKKNDILFSHINSDIHLGKTALFKNQTKTLIHGINLLLIRLCKEAQPDFFNYQFNYKRKRGEFITIASKSVNQSSINQPKLKNIDFVLPPLKIQQNIVSKIEELFSELDKGIEDLKTAQQQLKIYRQSVLKWAFEGKLTNGKVKDGVLPKGWKWVKLKEVAKDISDGDHQAPPKATIGIPFITISNINKSNNQIDFTNTFKVDTDYYLGLKQNRKPQKGDVLYTVTGSFGIPILIDYEKNFCFQRHIGLVRPLDTISQKWIFYLLQSPQVFNQAKETATGTAQKTVALGSLRNFDIAYCHYDEQIIIAQEIESRLSVADKMEESITQSLQQAEALRQSILKKAFSGELI